SVCVTRQPPSAGVRSKPCQAQPPAFSARQRRPVHSTSLKPIRPWPSWVTPGTSACGSWGGGLRRQVRTSSRGDGASSVPLQQRSIHGAMASGEAASLRKWMFRSIRYRMALPERLVNTVPYGKTGSMKSLERADWERAALQALAEEGLAAVAVEPLARRLGVT